MDTRKNYLTYCKGHAIDNLRDMQGWDISEYGCDLGMKLTESINVDGSATYNTYEAQEYIKEWFNEAAEVYEYEKSNYGEVLHNPFERPEAFMVCMIIYGIENMLSQCPTVNRFWNQKRLLSKTLINRIIKDIESISSINF